MKASWKVESAFALGRAGVPVGAWQKIVSAANARQRSNEAACSICPPEWTTALEKRADAAEARLRAYLPAFEVETRTDPRGCPVAVAGVPVAGDGFPADWYQRAERAAYAERETIKANAVACSHVFNYSSDIDGKRNCSDCGVELPKNWKFGEASK